MLKCDLCPGPDIEDINISFKSCYAGFGKKSKIKSLNNLKDTAAQHFCPWNGHYLTNFLNIGLILFIFYSSRGIYVV